MHRAQHALAQERIVINRRYLFARIKVVARLPVAGHEFLRVPVKLFGDAVRVDYGCASAHTAILLCWPLSPQYAELRLLLLSEHVLDADHQ